MSLETHVFDSDTDANNYGEYLSAVTGCDYHVFSIGSQHFLSPHFDEPIDWIPTHVAEDSRHV